MRNINKAKRSQQTAGRIPLYLTPGEAFTVQEQLRIAAAVHEAQQPEPGDVLQAVSQEAAAYTEHRDARVRAVSNRLGRAYQAHIRDRAGATKSARAAKSAKAKKKARPPAQKQKGKRGY